MFGRRNSKRLAWKDRVDGEQAVDVRKASYVAAFHIDESIPLIERTLDRVSLEISRYIK